MDSSEDDEIAQLRSTLLHSIRASKNRSSRGRSKHQEQIFDTDIDDLEALRLAALGTVKAGASASGNGSPSTSQQSSAPLLRPTQNPQFPAAPPQYRPRFPFNNRLKLTAPRSNLIVLTQTEPKKESYASNHAGLPHDRLNGSSANRMLNEPSAKRTDKWSRNRDSSSDDDSDGEQEKGKNGKDESGSEDGDRATSASDDLQTATDDDDGVQPALADGELIDVPEAVEEDKEDAASAAATAKLSTSSDTPAEVGATGASRSRRSMNRLPTMDEDELLLFDYDDDDLLLGVDDVDEAAMRAAADAQPSSPDDHDNDRYDNGPHDEPEVIVSDAPVREDAASRGAKQQSRRRRHSPTPPRRSAAGERRRSRSRNGGERREKRKLESELATVEGRLKQIYAGGRKESSPPSSSSSAGRRDRDGRRDGASSKEHSRRPVADDHQRRRVDDDRRRRSRSRSSHDRNAASGASRDDRAHRHHRQPSPADSGDRKRRERQQQQRGDDRRAAERPKSSTNASTDRRREQGAMAERSKAPLSSKSTYAGTKDDKVRSREEMPVAAVASSVTKTTSSSQPAASVKGAGKIAAVPKTSTASAKEISKPKKMDLTSLIVTVPVSPSTTNQQQPSQAQKNTKVVDLRQKLAISTATRKVMGSDDSAASGAEAASIAGRQSLSIKDRLAPIGQSRSLPANATPNKKQLESKAFVAFKEASAGAPVAVGQVKKRVFAPIRPPVTGSGAGEGIASTNLTSRSTTTGLTVVAGVAEGVPKKLQRVDLTSAQPQQQQRLFIVSDDAPKLDDLLSKQVNGSLDTNTTTTKRRIRLNRPTLQEA